MICENCRHIYQKNMKAYIIKDNKVIIATIVRSRALDGPHIKAFNTS